MSNNSFVIKNTNKCVDNSSINLWSQNKINGYIDNKLIIKLLKNNFKLRISTLGPDGTSSEFAAKHFLDLLNISNNESIILRPSFEDSMIDVLKETADVVIVANAYRNIERFYMNPDLDLISSFKCATPNYGIACIENYNLQSETNIEILTHRAPESLIPWFINKPDLEYTLVYSNSTSEAALRVKNKEFKYCVTNENALNLYGLKFVSRKRPIEMLWSIFCLAKQQYRE